jgi:hypothetical protein
MWDDDMGARVEQRERQRWLHAASKGSVEERSAHASSTQKRNPPFEGVGREGRAEAGAPANTGGEGWVGGICLQGPQDVSARAGAGQR